MHPNTFKYLSLAILGIVLLSITLDLGVLATLYESLSFIKGGFTGLVALIVVMFPISLLAVGVTIWRQNISGEGLSDFAEVLCPVVWPLFAVSIAILLAFNQFTPLGDILSYESMFALNATGWATSGLLFAIVVLDIAALFVGVSTQEAPQSPHPN